MDDLSKPAVEPSPPDHVEAPSAQSVGHSPKADAVAVVVSGRGRVGKTTAANTIVQFCRSKGATLKVWNADRQNETHSLNTFHPDALRPPTGDPEDKRLWLEERFDEQARGRFDVVLDMAGGDPLVRQLAKEARLVRTLARRGVQVTSVQVLGPDVADLDYLKLSMDGGLFMPEATVLLLNAGLVRSGRSMEAAFAEVIGSEVFMGALGLGAKLVFFPSLLCMSAVNDRGLTFTEAMRGAIKPGQEPVSFFDQSRVEIFWEDELPKFFGEIPAAWLPAMPNWKR